LLKQADLIGVLYLENSLASHVFTPARIAVLKLLASQAAIAAGERSFVPRRRGTRGENPALVDSDIIGISSGFRRSRC